MPSRVARIQVARRKISKNSHGRNEAVRIRVTNSAQACSSTRPMPSTRSREATAKMATLICLSRCGSISATLSITRVTNRPSGSKRIARMKCSVDLHQVFVQQADGANPHQHEQQALHQLEDANGDDPAVAAPACARGSKLDGGDSHSGKVWRPLRIFPHRKPGTPTDAYIYCATSRGARRLSQGASFSSAASTLTPWRARN